jgi:DNA mismatch repair ATPase MutS
MAGKSTFLRTVGINLVLAFAGGPVNAAEFKTIPSRLYTCIKVSDSVTDGISYFYAEVKRLKALLCALETEDDLPLFFFIDEIFRGTNNRERLLGSQAYVQALAGKHGVGLISTHDLELARLADLMPQVKNYHFRDEVSAEQMSFDYTLRPGPCPTTNALKIMALEGLPLPQEIKKGD